MKKKEYGRQFAKKIFYLLCMLFAFLSGGSDDLSIKEVKNTIFL